MVGWFIQEQEVWRTARFGKAAGDGEALFPTAGEALHGFVHTCFGEAEFAKDHAAKHFGFVMIAVHGRGLHGGGGGGDARRETIVKVITLRDVDNHCAALRAHDAFVWLFRTGKHAQERGLARAVGADEADAVAVGHADTHPVEEFAQAVGLGEISGDEEHGERHARGAGVGIIGGGAKHHRALQNATRGGMNATERRSAVQRRLRAPTRPATPNSAMTPGAGT